MRRLLLALMIVITIEGVLFTINIPKEFGKIYTLSYETIMFQNKLMEIRYPKFHFEGSTKLNKEVESLINKMWNSWKDFLISNIKEGFEDRTSYKLSFYLTFYNEKVISILFEESVYTGGAHSIERLKAINYSIEDEKVLHIKDLFVNGYDYKSAMNSYAKRYFKNVPMISEFESIDENQEFFLTPEGVVLFFQIYRYTPYSFGFPKIVVPYSEFKGFLRYPLEEE